MKTSDRCLLCGVALLMPMRADRARCASCRGIQTRPRVRAAIVHPTLPFERDVAAQMFVDQHPDGASLYEIGEALGVSHERVRQIEESAMRKIRLDMCGGA